MMLSCLLTRKLLPLICEFVLCKVFEVLISGEVLAVSIVGAGPRLMSSHSIDFS